MNVVALIFLLVSYTVTASMILAAAEPGTEIELPVLEVPELDSDFETSCSGIIDCTKFIGEAIISLVKLVLFVVTLLFNLVVYVFAIFLLIITLAATGVPGAPPLVNTLFFTVPMTVIAGIILYKMIRKGDTDAT